MKKSPVSKRIARFSISAILLAVLPHLYATDVPEGVWVRQGYELTVAVDSIKKPRFMEFGADGTLFVSVPKEGKILACRDKDGDGMYESVTPFVEGKDPKSVLQGLQFHDGWLWFAQLNSISRAKDINGDGQADREELMLGPD